MLVKEFIIEDGDGAWEGTCGGIEILERKIFEFNVNLVNFVSLDECIRNLKPVSLIHYWIIL